MIRIESVGSRLSVCVLVVGLIVGSAMGLSRDVVSITVGMNAVNNVERIASSLPLSHPLAQVWVPCQKGALDSSSDKAKDGLVFFYYCPNG